MAFMYCLLVRMNLVNNLPSVQWLSINVNGDYSTASDYLLLLINRSRDKNNLWQTGSWNYSIEKSTCQWKPSYERIPFQSEKKLSEPNFRCKRLGCWVSTTYQYLFLIHRLWDKKQSLIDWQLELFYWETHMSVKTFVSEKSLPNSNFKQPKWEKAWKGFQSWIPDAQDSDVDQLISLSPCAMRSPGVLDSLTLLRTWRTLV